MVACIVDKSVVRIDDAVRTPRGCAERIDIAFVIVVTLRKQAFVVAEAVASYAHAGSVGLKGSAFPSEFAGFGLCDEIGREMTVSVNI